MKCHYEVLKISVNATADEIKKAHRKLALECHPDKNLHRSEEAKEEFQLIQQAYEILSDPQERAWYDRHREEILHASESDKYKNDFLDVYLYYNTSCFKGYTDDEKGFYTVYREVFRKIAAEDEPFMDESDVEIPDFGYSYSSYDDVVHPFYAYWQSYCTAKTFAWVDTHSLTENRKAGAGRQILRLMEKENKKLRDQHRKQRNEEVRQLVAFVRKRDKRVQAHKKLLEEQNAEKARKFQEQRKKQMDERLKHLENYKETEWSSMSQFEDHFNEIEAHLDDAFGPSKDNNVDDSDQDDFDLYCIACDKDFRSIKSMENHENSKKHKENVLLLKEAMQNEEVVSLEQSLGDMPDLSYYGDGSLDENVSYEKTAAETVSKRKKKKKKKAKAVESDNDDDLSEITDAGVSKALSGLTISNQDQPILPTEGKAGSSALHTEVTKDKKKKKKKKHVDVDEDSFDLSERNESDVDSQSYNIKFPDQESSSSSPDGEIPKQVNTSVATNETTKETSKKKTGKAKKMSKKSSSGSHTMSVDAEKLSTICEKCGNNFHSRNKLFDHLKESGHAVYLGDSTASKPLKSSAKATAKTKKTKR